MREETELETYLCNLSSWKNYGDTKCYWKVKELLKNKTIMCHSQQRVTKGKSYLINLSFYHKVTPLLDEGKAVDNFQFN